MRKIRASREKWIKSIGGKTYMDRPRHTAGD